MSSRSRARSTEPAGIPMSMNGVETPPNGDSNGVGTPSKVPSYVGISCAISGYPGGFSRHSPSSRANGADSRGSSPTMLPSENVRMTRCRTASGLATISSPSIEQQQAASGPTSPVKVIADQVPLLVNSSNCENGTTGIVGEGGKSLLQQKIESLYGSSFADGWRNSRCKSRPKASTKYRSPSCPPRALKAGPGPAVFRRLNDEFLQQLEINQDSLVSKPLVVVVVTDKKRNIEIPAPETNFEPGMQTAVIASPIRNNGDIEVIHENNNGTSNSMDEKQNSDNLRNGTWFLSELNSICDRIRQNVDEVEGYIETESETITEEVLGNLRATIGKANLLLKQKLNQFRDLCLKNINQDDKEQYVTTNEDLEGFWEMVMIQIHEINDTFVEITRLKRNNWKPDNIPPKIAKPKTTNHRYPSNRGSPKSLPPGGSPSRVPTTPAALNREQLRRDRLREAKRRQAERLAKAEVTGDEDQITIFMPNTGDSNGAAK